MLKRKRLMCFLMAAVLSVTYVTMAVAGPQTENGSEASSPGEGVNLVPREGEETDPSSRSGMAQAEKPILPAVLTAADQDGEMDYEVEWYVRYVDKETHSIELASEEHGYIENGSEIYVGFSETVTDDDGNIWTATTQPGFKTIWGPGVNIIYIEYELTGSLPEEYDPYADAEGELAEWLEKAKAADALLMDCDPEDIPSSRIICDTEGKANLRLISAGSAISDTEGHEIYLIANGIVPTGIILKETFGTDIVYSKDKKARIEIGDEEFTVYRFILMRNYDSRSCTHDYRIIAEKSATCLTRGYTKYECTKCRDVKLKYSAATGHHDEHGDSVCDRCGYRVYEESLGNKITTTLKTDSGTYTLSWTLVDEDYEGGCLYIADDGLPVDSIGGYGSGKDYIETALFKFLSVSFGNNHSINGDNLITFSEDGSSAAAHMLSAATALKYRDLMAAGDYVTHTADGESLMVIKTDSTTETVGAEENFTVRPAIVLSKPWITEGTPQHWSVGDKLTRKIDGQEYDFTCIDDNYSDTHGNHTLSALFLCDTVIPAGYGGEYRTQIDGSGHYTSVWYPGPLAYFGDSNDYKYSKLRQFLDGETVFGADDLVIGIANAYTGSTTAGRYSQTLDDELKTYSIGYQQMTARLFILSVDEAIRYKNHLWKFNGSNTDNPEAVMESTCQGYWLRNPCGTNNDYMNTDQAYVVDLAKGNIHPQDIRPEGGTGDEYLDTQTAVGIRPAFTLENR